MLRGLYIKVVRICSGLNLLCLLLLQGEKRKVVELPNSPQCSEDLVNIEEALMQGQLLQEAFACGKPEPWIIVIIALNTSMTNEGLR